MKRKTTSVILAAAMVSSLFVSVNVYGADDASGGSIKFLNNITTVTEDMCKDFEEETGIHVEYEFVDAADYSAKFSALAASGDIPDVFWTQSAYYADQIEEGYLLDMQDYLYNTDCYEGGTKWADTYEEALLENFESLAAKNNPDAGSVDFGVPYVMTSVAVMYDKNTFDKLGLSEPETWDDFMNCCQVLKDNGITPFAVQSATCDDWIPRFIWDQTCREKLDKNPGAFESGEMKFNDETVVEGLNAFKEMWDKEYLIDSYFTCTNDDVSSAFVQGNLGMLAATPGRITYVMENKTEEMDVATFAFPGYAGLPLRSLGGAANIYGVYSESENIDAAVTFLKWLTSASTFSTQETLKYENSGIKGVERGEELDAAFSGFTKASEGGFCPEIFVPTTVTTEINDVFKNDLLPNLAYGSYDTEYVCDTLQELYDEYLESLK
ncbi:extracellular solute-binding protein [Blautia schinkii]|nr:extracellular solute-binding protein [Blautia schinkii]